VKKKVEEKLRSWKRKEALIILLVGEARERK